MGTVAFVTVLVVHLVTVAGMIVAASLQLVLAPGGPLRILKWVWLPTVGGATVSGLLLWVVAVLADHQVDPLKMIVKILATALGSAIAARFHAADRADTPRWVVPAMSTVVGGEVVLSLVWS